MRLNLLSVGKIKEAYLRTGILEYTKRLRALQVGLNEIEIPETKGEAAKCRQEESSKLLEKSNGSFLAFDPTGENISSEEFAQILKNFEAQGEINLIIGGSHGLSNEIRQKAKRVLSFGKITYPHQLFRLLVLEQTYRAFTILRKKTYHK
jgi:23S rRNA (pseudouridine1915-N3)-methyltransferase